MSPSQEYERNNSDSQENRFVYRYEVPSLQAIASHTVTKAIWLHDTKAHIVPGIPGQRSYCYCINKFFCIDVDTFQEGSQHLIQHLKVPGCIEEMLRNSLRNINRQALSWGDYLYEAAEKHQYLTSDFKIRHIDPNWCVWSWNGEIDFRKSMKKMLEVGGLTEYQKFSFMAEFCMEDEIVTFSLDSLPPEIVSNVDYSKCNVCFYWICYLKNELHKIPVENTYSVDFTMAMQQSHYTFVNEYFVNRLDDNDQIKIFSYWIRLSYERNISTHCILLERILSKMSWHQQQRLFSEMSHIIITFFAIFSDSSQYAVWAWKNSKDQMTVDRFTELIDKMFDKYRSIADRYIDKVKTSTFSFSLSEIWNTAVNHQKNFAIRMKMDDFICNCLKNRCSEFLIKFLQFISPDERKKWIFSKVEDDIVYRCDARIIDILLPHPDDQLTFRQLMRDSANLRLTLKLLLEDLRFDDIDQLLKRFVSPDASVVRVFKQKYLQEESTRCVFIEFITNINKWNKLSTFIDEIFEFDSISALKIKQQFITTLAAFIIYSSDFLSLKINFDDLVEIVEMTFSNNELRTVKRLFSDHHRQLLERCKTSCYCTEYIVKSGPELYPRFQQWCLVDDDLADHQLSMV